MDTAPERKEINVEDKLTNQIGEFGRWQIMFFVIVIIPVKFSAYTMPLGIIFLAPKTIFRCTETNTTDEIKNLTCYSDCVKYEYYNQNGNNIISEWDLICDRAWLANFAQSSNMFGILIGSLVFGFLSDRFGRRSMLLLACMMQLAMSFGIPFCNNYWIFTVARFMLGTATAGTMIGTFVILTEITGPSYREVVTCMYQIPSFFGEIVMPVFGYYLKSWDTFSLGIAMPTLIYLLYFFVLPESPKWLISVNRLQEASVVMTKAAKLNRCPKEDMLETAQIIANDVNISKDKKPTQATYMDLIRIPTLRIRNLCCCISWFLLGISYYGTSQYMGQTSSNIFITMGLSGSLKIATVCATGYLFRRFGRRPTMFGFLAGSCVCSGLLAMPDSWFYAKLVAGAVSISCVSGAFSTLYTYTSELFPTVARTMAMGASSTVSRVGSALAPFVAGLGSEAAWLPPLIFTLAPLTAMITCWFLPETKGKKMTDTLFESIE